ncbi:MAG: methyltransferase domain-containing protein [Candidatus Heimdallarchaeaceae archaeon]
MTQQIPIVNHDLHLYLIETLGSTLTKRYLKAVASPQEMYTLHIFSKYEDIDGIIELLRHHKYKASIHPEFQNLIVITPKGPFTVDVSNVLKEIIVDNRASEMIYQGANVFVPGIKRANKVKKGDIVKIRGQHGIIVAKAKALMNHNKMLATKKGIAAKTIEAPYQVPSLTELGLEKEPVYFQSLPAYLVSMNIEPEPHERILDCCAAPGNKTIHLSELTGNNATIIAVDRSTKRLSKLEQKCHQFHLTNIRTVSGNIIELSKEWTLKFDKIIVDPPCTALGLRPKLSIGFSKDTTTSTAKYQKAILFACNKLLKKGGTIVYSTCTITTSENEETIEYAISDLNLEIVEQQHRISSLRSLTDTSFPVQRFIPGIHKTVGYFIAKLQKR